jgi:hypothetical protein
MAKEKKDAVEVFLDNIYPGHDELQVDKQGGIHTIIVDEETDGFKAKFNYDGCIEIDTDGYSYITLSANTLRHLANLIEEADKIYSKRTDKEWQKYSK